MNVRFASKKDLKEYLTIKKLFLKEYGINRKSDSFIIKEFNKYLKRCIIFAEIDGKIIGHLLGTIENDDYEKYGYISEIFIIKKYRGKGFSTKLKDKFIEYLKKKRIAVCRLDVTPTKDALRVYEKWGFKIDKYRMSRSIKNEPLRPKGLSIFG